MRTKAFSSSGLWFMMAATTMSFSQKGYRTLNHRDVQYRWLMKQRNGVNEVSIYTNAAIGGRELIAELPRIVKLSLVGEAIDFGNANGWNPNEEGEPLRCRHSRKGFSLAD
ncbi:hypothetical protein HZ994_00050 [Akkermansiaceae bacterium]|nr:hypothetical protein HZ994_00050 [Akkermansiaceae bacterium]